MGPYGLICSCPFGYNIPFFLLYISFFISFVKSFYIIMYKIMKPDKAVLKKKRLQSSYINIPPLQHVHAGLKMELTAAEASFLVLF